MEKIYEMNMARDSQNFTVVKKRSLLPFQGTELMIYPVLPGLRTLTGEKIQRYLASELRDRIKASGANIRVVDRTDRAEYVVVPIVLNANIRMPIMVTYDHWSYVTILLPEFIPPRSVSLKKYYIKYNWLG